MQEKMNSDDSIFKQVLFVAPNFKKRKGGIASVMLLYSESINEFNFFSSVIYQNKYINFLLFPFTIVNFIFYLLLNKQYKIIHIHGSSKGSFYRKYILFIISRIYKRKVVYHIHGSEYHLFFERSNKVSKRVIKSMINGVDTLVVLSQEWKDFFIDNFEQSNIQIVNNIVAFQNPIDKSYPEYPLSLVFLGRIGQRKGIWDLIQVISENKKIFSGKIKLYVGGDGDINKLNERISADGLEEFIYYLGWVKGDAKKRLLNKSDILILPSYNEGLPISLLEGMSYSMPLVASNVGGIPQILVNNENGFCFAPGDHEKIKQALIYYIESPEEIIKHGNNSYKMVQKFFPSDVILSLKSIYFNLV